MTPDTTPDADKIDAEMGETGDTRTNHPRLVCDNCDSFVYLTSPRATRTDHVRAECDCRHGDPMRGELPLEWMRIDEYVERGDES
jgi:hypothetical protein